jgi:hypothetical protein
MITFVAIGAAAGYVAASGDLLSLRPPQGLV